MHRVLGRYRDTAYGYGWVSILLHWATAAAIVGIWFVGDSIGAPGTGSRDSMLHRHTTIALLSYAALVLRVAWRVGHGHPQRLPMQGKFSFLMGQWLHYALLFGVVVMLVSGPLLAWSGGLPLRLLEWTLPAPFSPSPATFAWMHRIHASTAALLMLGVVLHVGAVLAHLPIPKDPTFERMIVPAAEGATAHDPAAEGLRNPGESG
jgi:cytochrome b561